MSASSHPFKTLSTLSGNGWTASYHRLPGLEQQGFTGVSSLPFTIKIMLENVLRRFDGYVYTEDDIRRVANWDPAAQATGEFPFLPSRVVLQDFTGVPA